ncbi:hypothetical protein BLA29_015222 [Euroglyphus maynei]|uniref:Uncharacterized protein n=1 Tax=Euroglyphus maynei TaxID=6958 RepID=A0A1Y3BH39_EURMA|nr:hypothetical protein BLA29_015222 [Euroglyphus maynei]
MTNENAGLFTKMNELKNSLPVHNKRYIPRLNLITFFHQY